MTDKLKKPPLRKLGHIIDENGDQVKVPNILEGYCGDCLVDIENYCSWCQCGKPHPSQKQK